MNNFMILLISATVGSIGFAMLFNIRIGMLPWATLGAIIDAIVFLIFSKFTPNLFLSTIAGAIAATIYSDIMSRKLKVPSTLLLLPSIVPLVPGGSLYYTMSSVINMDRDGLFKNGLATIEGALGIAVGILIASLFSKEYRQFKNNFKEHTDSLNK